jgi:hypothetical protein
MSGTLPILPSGILASTVSNPPTFRSHFTPFASAAQYPDPAVQMFLDVGASMCSPQLWCQYQQLGSELVCAHFLAMQQFSAQGGQGGGVPGLNRGLVNSKSVSKVSVGYDVGETSIEGGGPWNYTLYGTQFLWWAQLVGTGGYETLSLATPGIDGIVMTWARGVLIGWLPW